MIHAKQYIHHPKRRLSAYRTITNNNNISDRPLIAQLCGNDPSLVLQCAKLIQHTCDAIDINFGCPQNIAKKGNYGAFLLNQPQIMCSIIHRLHNELKIPVTCKIRILPSEEETLNLVHMLCKAGISILTVHGRTLKEKKDASKDCDWKMIKKIKLLLASDTNEYRVPVFANGGCETLEDVHRCLQITQCDGYMAAESLLTNPAMFLHCSQKQMSMNINRNECNFDCFYDQNQNERKMNVFSSIEMTKKYLAITETFDENIKVLRSHLHKLLFRELNIFTLLRISICKKDKYWLQTKLIPILVEKISILNEKYSIYDILYSLTRNWYHRHWKNAKQKSISIVLEYITDMFDKRGISVECDIQQLMKYFIECGIIDDGNCMNNIGIEIYEQLSVVDMMEEKVHLQKKTFFSMLEEKDCISDDICDTFGEKINALFGDNEESSDDENSDTNQV